MTLALRYAVRSDVGLLREGNEDSAYAGPHLLAVADGMGGHAAGEVASAATITTIAVLDGDYPGADLVSALEDAVARANLRLQELIISDPAIEGMGTTLTAMLWSDGYAALCHIGDSRAYLLRDGQFVQITHDHTLVQSLVDEGKITEDDVATHPHRSLLLRALDGRTIAEPDLNSIETVPGDRFLLCSDGLSGVVTEQTLYQTLSSVPEPDKAALALVDLAIRGGGPDNITCIVADVIDTFGGQAPALEPTFAGAAAHGAPDTAPATRQSSPATRAMRLTRTNPQPAAPDEPTTGIWPGGGYQEGYTGAFDTSGYEGSDQAFDTAPFDRPDSYFGPDGDQDQPEPGPRVRPRGGHRAAVRRSRYADADDYGGERRKRRWPIVTGALVLLVLLVGGGLYGAWLYNQGQYYVGTENGYVAIFRGTNDSVAGISLSSLVQRSTLPTSQLRSSDQAALQQTISQGSVNDARMLIDQLLAEADACKAKWRALAAWQVSDVSYQAYQQELAHALTTKAKQQIPKVANPGPMPTAPEAADCAPSTAFGIAASALPTKSQTQPVQPTTPVPGTPTTAPARTPTAKPPTAKPAPKVTGQPAKVSPTARTAT